MIQKMGTMNLILIILATVLITFTGVMIWLYNTTGGIPDTLVTCVFSICGGEFGVMGWIKTTKEKWRNKGDD